MKNNLSDFLRDDTGAYSIMRGIYFLCFLLVTALVITIIIMAVNMQPVIIETAGVKTVIQPDVSVLKELTFLIFGILGIPTTGKFIQTFGERTVNSEKSEVKQ